MGWLHVWRRSVSHSTTGSCWARWLGPSCSSCRAQVAPPRVPGHSSPQPSTPSPREQAARTPGPPKSPLRRCPFVMCVAIQRYLSQHYQVRCSLDCELAVPAFPIPGVLRWRCIVISLSRNGLFPPPSSTRIKDFTKTLKLLDTINIQELNVMLLREMRVFSSLTINPDMIRIATRFLKIEAIDNNKFTDTCWISDNYNNQDVTYKIALNMKHQEFLYSKLILLTKTGRCWKIDIITSSKTNKLQHEK